MCGIAGTLTWRVPPDACVVRRMADVMRHRGPDAGGVVTRGPLALGHRRLSIIDLSAANNQPLADHGGRVWISFNGEIYNYRQLRREFIGHGARFRTAGDTEVILEAYNRQAPSRSELAGTVAQARSEPDCRGAAGRERL